MLRWPALALALAAGAVCLLGLAAPWWWWGELACHWSLHAVALLFPALWLWRRCAVVAGPLLALLLLGLWPALAAAWRPHAPPPGRDAPVLKLAVGNIYGRSPEHAQAIARLAWTAADVVVLVEAVAGDRELCAGWQHQAWADNPRNRDAVALLSRHPLAQVVIHTEDGTVPFIEAVVRHPAGDLRVVACHPTAPHHPGLRGWRDRQWAQLAAVAAAGPAPVVVAGDLNGSPATPMWRVFADAGLLRPAGRGAATWPAWAGPFGIPIDQVIGRGVAIARHEAFALPGSDHRGVVAAVALAQPSGGMPKPK